MRAVCNNGRIVRSPKVCVLTRDNCFAQIVCVTWPTIEINGLCAMIGKFYILENKCVVCEVPHVVW